MLDVQLLLLPFVHTIKQPNVGQVTPHLDQLTPRSF